LEAEGKSLLDPRIEHVTQKNIRVPDGAIVILGGSDRSFAQDRAAGECRTDLAQKLTTARHIGSTVVGRFFCWRYISSGIFLIHCDLSVLADRPALCDLAVRFSFNYKSRFDIPLRLPFAVQKLARNRSPFSFWCQISRAF
jgi:hypothetical protein